MIAFDGFETSLKNIKDPDQTFTQGEIVESEVPSLWGKAVFIEKYENDIMDPEDVAFT